jgi:hypothetical protein
MGHIIREVNEIEFHSNNMDMEETSLLLYERLKEASIT